jgi:hypothetical protein
MINDARKSPKRWYLPRGLSWRANGILCKSIGHRGGYVATEPRLSEG